MCCLGSRLLLGIQWEPMPNGPMGCPLIILHTCWECHCPVLGLWKVVSHYFVIFLVCRLSSCLSSLLSCSVSHLYYTLCHFLPQQIFIHTHSLSHTHGSFYPQPLLLLHSFEEPSRDLLLALFAHNFAQRYSCNYN